MEMLGINQFKQVWEMGYKSTYFSCGEKQRMKKDYGTVERKPW
jgi:hypothetical protein